MVYGAQLPDVWYSHIPTKWLHTTNITATPRKLCIAWLKLVTFLFSVILTSALSVFMDALLVRERYNMQSIIYIRVFIIFLAIIDR